MSEPEIEKEIDEAVDELVKSASELPKPNQDVLAERWATKADHHRKQAKYFEKRAMFTRRDQELTLQKIYSLCAAALKK